jgi:hypothetical protein
MKVVTELRGEGFQTQQITFESEPGLEIKGKLYLPLLTGRKAAVLLVSARSTTSLAERIVKSGRVVLELEPCHSPTGNDNRPYLGDWVFNTRAGMIGANLPAMRARDILSGLYLLAARTDLDPTAIRAATSNVKGIWLLLASALDTRISRVWLDRTPHSLRAALETPLNTNLHDAVIPGFILRWDLQDLREAMGRTVLWTDPTNWMNRTVPLGDRFRYRHLEQTDDEYLEEFLR